MLASWLEKPVYTEGVLLYERLIGAGFVLSMLKTGPDDYNRNVLTEALQQKHDALLAEKTVRQQAYPEPLKQQEATSKLQQDERTILKERLRIKFNSGSPGDEDSKAWAFNVLDIRDSLTDFFGRQDFFDEHGYLPDEEQLDTEQSLAALYTRRNSIRTYLSKYKKTVDNPLSTAEQVDTAVDKLKAYRSELFQIEQQIARLTGTLQDHPQHD